MTQVSDGVQTIVRSSRLFFIALGTALSALLVTPVAAADEPPADTDAELEVPDVEDWTLLSAGWFGRNTERTPAVVLGLKTVRPGHDPEMIGVFFFSRRPALSARQPGQRSPLRIAPARQNGVWVLVAEGRF